MPRQKKVEGSHSLHVCIDAATWVKLHLHLVSEAHGRKVPYNAKAKLITQLLSQYFEGKIKVRESLERTRVERLYDLVSAAHDLASTENVSKEAFKPIAAFMLEARALLRNERIEAARRETLSIPGEAT